MEKYLLKTNGKKGITLISLVVTIIILLILAGVAIYLILGDDGIFKRTQDATDRYKAEEIIEEMQIVKANTAIDNKGKFDKDDFFDNLVEEGIVGDREEIIDNGDGSHTITTDEGYIIDIIEKDDGKDVEIEYVGKGDKVGPRIKEIHVRNKTTNAIEIEVEASNSTGAKYTYLYKLESEEKYKEAATKIVENTYKYEKLEANKIYNIKVEVENNGIKAEKEINVLTGTLPEGAISIGEVVWENGKAKVEVNINKEIEGNLRLEYKINEEGEWTEIQDGGIIENLEHNQTVYVRLTDGTNETEYLSTKIEDNIKPEVSISLGTITSNSIQVQVTANDKETGLVETNTYEYFLNDSSQGTSTSNTHTFSNLFDDTSYTLKVVVKDKAGLTNEAEVIGKTNLVPSGTEQGVITFTSPTWSTNGTASINISTNTNYKIEYQKNGTTGTWTEIANNGIISNLNHNDTVYARLTDGVNAGEFASTSIKDDIAPTVSINASDITQTSVKLTVTASDNQSGLAEEGAYTYYLDDVQKINNNTNSYTYTGLTASTKYILKVVVKDKAGKTTEKSTTITTTDYPIVSATDITANAIEYYGAEVTGYTCTNSAAVSKWRIFYADSTNIYLIADDYIHIQYAPNGKDGSRIQEGSNEYKMVMDPVTEAYNGGSTWISNNSKGKKWLSMFLNSDYANKSSSSNAVAYMMDTNVWGVFAGQKAEYAMGGPTIELFCASYKQTHPSKYVECSVSLRGYKVKYNTSSSYSYAISGLPKDDFNQIYIKGETSKANAMWLASPAAENSLNVMYASFTGWIDNYTYNGMNAKGFRPIVCLKSDVRLKKTAEGIYAIQ